MKRIFLSIALMLILSSSVFAGGYGYNYNIVQPVIVKQKVVQFDQRYFQGTDGYYSAVGEIKAERAAEAQDSIEELKALNAALRAQIELLIKLCKGGTETPAVPNPVPVPTEPTTPPTEPGTGEDSDDVTALDEAVYDIMLNKCASCHNEKDKKGGLVLINKSTGAMVWQPLENRAAIHEHVRRVNLEAKGLSPMPPGAPLPDNQVETMYQWMQEEATKLREK